MAACGDVVRNVTTTPAPRRDAVQARLEADAVLLSSALLPKSRAHHEIFLDGAPLADEAEEETLYGRTYLPRKFKIGIATAADNTVDVLSNDLGLVAVFEGERLVGYNVAIGGGMGMTHNRADTFPRVASVVGSVRPDELLAVTEAVIRLQRDHRRPRRPQAGAAEIRDRGPRAGVGARRAGGLFRPAARRAAADAGLRDAGIARVARAGQRQMVARRSRAVGADQGPHPVGACARRCENFALDVVMTPQQDVLLTNVKALDRIALERLLRGHGLTPAEQMTKLARWTLACPALPTCGLALTEAERARDDLVSDLEAALGRHGLLEERISFRITGCPNGCARSYTGDIGLVGRVPGAYAIFVGGDFAGTRLSFKLAERVKQAEIGAMLEPIFAAFARGRRTGEGFGDFCTRLGRDALLALGAVPELAAD